MSKALALPGIPFVDVPNPLDWLGDQAGEVAANSFKGAMVGLWSAALWVLEFAFKIIDAFVVPELSVDGVMGTVYPYTFGLATLLVLLLAFFQIGYAVATRKMDSIGTLLVGLLQFGLVWVGFIAFAAAMVAGAGGLTQALLSQMLDVDNFAAFTSSGSWPRDVNDTVTATVLGITGILIVIPAAFAYIALMIVREAILIVLVATSPIAAAGLVAETSRAWFWKLLRWFLSAVFLAPVAALMLGIGAQIANGVVIGTGGQNGTTAAQAVGTAVVGSVLILIGAVCPVVLFKLLAFVDPGTPQGTAMRKGLSDAGGAGGMLGKLAGSGGGSGSGASTQQSGSQSQGEKASESQTSNGMMSAATKAFGPAGKALGAVSSIAGKAAAMAEPVLAAAGIGDAGPSAHRPSGGGSTPSTSSGGGPSTSNSSAGPNGPDGDAAQDAGSPAAGGGAQAGAPMPQLPAPPVGGMPGAGGPGAGAAGGEAAAIPVVPV